MEGGMMDLSEAIKPIARVLSTMDDSNRIRIAMLARIVIERG